jgi:hypothetical protein
MFKRTIIWMPALFAGFLFYSVGGAKTAQPTAAPTPEKRKPIVCKWNTLGGMRYYYAGLKIADGQSLKKIISPLNDPEANRLLDVSSGSHTAGVAFLIGGIPCLVGGLLTAGSNYDNTTRSLNSTGTAGLIVAAVGLVGDYIGAFKLQESKTSEFAAVQRYNVLVRGEEETSWNLPKSGVQTELLTLKF